MEHQHAFEILASRVVRTEAKTNRATHTAKGPHLIAKGHLVK